MNKWQSHPHWQRAIFGSVILVGSLLSINMLIVAERLYGGVPLLSTIFVIPLLMFAIISPIITLRAAYLSFSSKEAQRTLSLVPVLVSLSAIYTVVTIISNNPDVLSAQWIAAII